MMTKTINTFETQQEAIDWLEQFVNDPCVDNVRLAKASDAEAVETYRKQAANGCCGSSDVEVEIGGELYFIGCNYGH